MFKPGDEVLCINATENQFDHEWHLPGILSSGGKYIIENYKELIDGTKMVQLQDIEGQFTAHRFFRVSEEKEPTGKYKNFMEALESL